MRLDFITAILSVAHNLKSPGTAKCHCRAPRAPMMIAFSLNYDEPQATISSEIQCFAQLRDGSVA